MTGGTFDDHNAAMLSAFGKLLTCEDVLRQAEVAHRDATILLSLKVAEAETALAEAWRTIESLMAESGEFEVVLPGTVTDYKISRSTPRTSVKVVSPDAVPDEFVKFERKPKLKEIGEHLNTLAPDQRPNWASLEKGEGKLGWKAAKKGAA